MDHHLLDLEIVDSIREVGDFRANDEFARELFELFSEQASLSMRELGAAGGRGDLSQVRYFAHRLKGSAANIGACVLAQRAGAIEEAAHGGGCDAEYLAAATRELAPVLAQSLTALSGLLLASTEEDEISQ